MADVSLTAADGFEFSAYQRMPEGAPRGAAVVIQEIFGVNAHIRNVVDGYADAGYAAIAPALFDRLERNVQLGYAEEEDWNKGMKLAFEQFDRAANVREVKLVYTTFAESMKRVAVNESAKRKSQASKPIASTESKKPIIGEQVDFKTRMKKLANII